MLTLIVLCLSCQLSFAQISAQFTVSKTIGCGNTEIEIVDQSTGDIVQWDWNFGNGVVKLETVSQSYKFVYSPGLYTITLTVSDGTTTDTKSIDLTINELPTPDFEFDSKDGCVHSDVVFEYKTESEDEITKYHWEFGDGGSSTEKNPVYQYNKGGIYSVSLTVTDESGCKSTVKKDDFVELTNKLDLSFEAETLEVCQAPLSTTFTPFLSESVSNFHWDFGDGEESEEQNPSHTYANDGVYSVTLTTQSKTGCVSTKTIYDYVKINATKVSVAAEDVVCVGDSLTIIGTVNSEDIISWKWTLGDGNIVSDKSEFKYVYEKSGNFDIKSEVINGLGCTVTASQKIVVNPLPNVDFSVNRSHWCIEDETMPITFSSSISDAQLYSWDFGDGERIDVIDSDVMHTYENGTSFDVALFVKDKNGCENEITKVAAVTKSNPVVDFLVTDDYVKSHFCVNEPIYIENVSYSLAEIVDIKWEYLYDRSSETKNTETVLEYNKAGEYPIRLTYTDIAGCVGVKEEILKVGDGDLVTAKVTKPKVLSYCPHEMIEFESVSTGTETMWEWVFTNRTTNAKKDTFLYATTFQMSFEESAQYSILLIPYQYSCPGFFESKKITINPPKADFEYYPLVSCSFPDTIHFDPAISVGAERYSWNFGDGGVLDVIPTGEDGHFKWVNPATSEVLNADTTSNVPYHIYTEPGAYDVKLTTYAGSCEDEIIKTFNTSGIAIGFSCDTNSVCQGTEITFVDTSNIVSGTISKRIWTFNDQSIETTNESFPYTFENSGIYNVSMVVQTEDGCRQTIVKNNFVTVHQLPTCTTFETIGEQTGCVEYLVDFQLNPSPEVQKYIWNYGDGKSDTTASSKSNTHRYGTGSYLASVTVVDVNGCSQSSDNLTITISNPISDFSIPQYVCGGEEIIPINKSTGESLKYIWNWGDGENSSERDASHSYAKTDGVRNVTLKVVDENGCESSKMQQVYVHQPQAKFSSAQTIFICPPADVVFVNESRGENLRYEWNIGDENSAPLTANNTFWQYQTAGTYDISLIATDEFGCVDTLIKTDYINVVGPVGKFKVEPETGCKNTEFSFVAYDVAGVSEYDFVFGDGQYKNTTESSAICKYSDYRTYMPMLTLKDENGCELSLEGNLVKVVGTNIKPDFSIAYDNCYSDEIIPEDNSKGTNLTYSWDWGDGSVSEGKDAKHLYAKEDAVYNVTLLLIDENGCDTSQTVTTHIHRPTALFFAEQTEYNCPPVNVSLVNESVGSKMSYEWYVADTMMTESAVTATYNTVGDFDVKLLVTDEYGCVDSLLKSQYIRVNGPLGKFKVEPDSGCTYTDFSFIAYDTEDVAEYVWDFGDNIIYYGTSNTEQHSFLGGNVYEPSLTIVDANGCEKVLRGNPITVFQVIPDFVGDTLLCESENVSFTDKSVEKQGGIDSWLWIFKNGENVDSVNTKNVDYFLDYGVYDVQLQTKVNGCVYTKDSVQFLKIYETPEIDFDISENPTKMKELIYFKNNVDTTIYSEPITWIWKLGDLYSENAYDLSYKFSRFGVFDIMLEGYIHKECRDSVTIPLTVECAVNIPNVFTPNGDGINDIFFEDMPDIELIIMNRWGQELYKGYEGWDGTYNGKEMTAGTYFYFITLPNGDTYNGPLMLIRN